MHFLTFPPAHTELDKASMTHLKIAQKYVYVSCEFCTFPVTEGNKIQHIYSSLQPQQESSPTTQNLNAERHEFQEHHNYSSLRTRESSKPNPERHEFWEHRNYSSLQTRESSKPNPERQEF